MTEDTSKNNQTTVPAVAEAKTRIVQRRVQGSRSPSAYSRNDSRQRDRGQREKKEFETEIISMGRVTKVTGGGKRMRMSVFVIIGDKAGNIGFGNGKGVDIRVAQEKAVEFAKRHMIKVPLKGATIPHEINVKFGAAKLWMKPAAPGTGIVAGGPVRKVLEVAGVKDVLTKQIGTNNKVLNAYATIEALRSMKIQKS